MIGRDYYCWGSKKHISHRFGDNNGNPYPGPVYFTFYEQRGKLILWNRMSTIYIQNLLGHIDTQIHPVSSKTDIESKLASSNEFYEEDDWKTQYLLGKGLLKPLDKTTHVYIDIVPVALCLIPETNLIAVVDIRCKIKVIDLDSYEIKHSWGGPGIEGGGLSSPTAIEAIKIGSQHVLFLGDSGANQRVTAYTLGGQALCSLGTRGPLLGQFRDIASLSAKLLLGGAGSLGEMAVDAAKDAEGDRAADSDHVEDASDGDGDQADNEASRGRAPGQAASLPAAVASEEDADLWTRGYFPAWLLPALPSEQLEDILYDRVASGAGGGCNFVLSPVPDWGAHRFGRTASGGVGKDESAGSGGAMGYNLLYMGRGHKIHHLLVRYYKADDDDIGSAGSAGSVSGTSRAGRSGYYIANKYGNIEGEGDVSPHLLPLLQTQPYLRFGGDVRDIAMLAVVDKKNCRVQLVRMKWTENYVYSRVMEVAGEIGGVRGVRARLQAPQCVKWAPHGELVILDTQIVIMSPNLELVKVVYLPFQTLSDALHIESAQSHGAADTSAGASPHANAGAGELDDDDDDTPSPLRYRGAPVEKHKCMCWVDVSPRGQLGVSYKSGGVYFFEAGRAGTVGTLSKLEVSALESILSDFLSFPDVVAMRATCLYMHNFTKELRMRGSLIPASRRELFLRYLHLFCQLSKQPPHNLNELKQLQITDKFHRKCCERHLKDVCVAKDCRLSHSPPFVDRFELLYSRHFVDYEDLVCIICHIYGPLVYDKYEAYLHALHHQCYGVDIHTSRREEKSKVGKGGGPVVRKEVMINVKGLYFPSYLELLLSLEEHLNGSKDISQHKLFYRGGAGRNLPPYPTSLDSLIRPLPQPHSPSRSPTRPSLIADPLAQYDRGLGACGAIKAPGLRIVTVPGYEDLQKVRGSKVIVSLGVKEEKAEGVKEHVEVVGRHLDRAADRIDSLFR